jgi:hypothetical protein
MAEIGSSAAGNSAANTVANVARAFIPAVKRASAFLF